MKFEQCQLNDVLAGVIDYRGKTPTKTESGIRLVTAKVIKKGRVINDGPQEYIHPKTYDEVMRRGVPERNDIFITTEAPLGELALWDSDEQIALAQRVILLRPDPKKIDTQYLFYHLQSIGFQAQLHANATGTTVPGIKNPVLRSLTIRFPHIDQQREIGQILSNYDGLIETNRRRITLLEESARLLYREWFVNLRFPGHESTKWQDGLPQGWRRAKLSDICEQIREQVIPSSVTPETPYLSMEHMTPKSICLGAWETAGKVSSSKILFRRGDVLFGRIRPYFHKVGLAQVDGITSTDMIVTRPSNENLRPILLLAMSTDEFVEHAVTTSNGTKMPRADWKVLKNWEIILPPNNHVTEFSEITQPMLDAIETFSRQNIELTKARDELLPKLMSGTLQI
jgi:type I restriction enzyme S subunit